MADIESEILVREIGRLGGWFGGGIGARWAARRLPCIPFETNFELQHSLSEVASAVEALLTKIGKRVPEMESNPSAGLFHAVVGSGHLNLNPTVVRIQLQPLESCTSVFIRAVAKEGAIKQHFAQLAVERIRAALGGKVS